MADSRSYRNRRLRLPSDRSIAQTALESLKHVVPTVARRYVIVAVRVSLEFYTSLGRGTGEEFCRVVREGNVKPGSTA
jgi:hypothetical protein